MWRYWGIHFSIIRSLHHPFVSTLAQMMARIICCGPCDAARGDITICP